MQATVFVGISVDGFLARLDGSFDFLPEAPEEHGYTEFFASVDALVIGRGTWETVETFPKWPYGTKPVVVLSSRPLDLSRVSREAVVEQMNGEPKAIVEQLSARGFRRLYVDGGVTIQRFLRAGQIQRLVVTRVPVLIGTGRPLFGALDADIRLTHVATRSYPSGLVQSEYAVRG